ncbi:MAG: RimK family alpha-L-glutamate ligase [Candidatus Wallbacteria bacterium]|nr:RimK family alpha-L-glutamate ligase [Candidatus Wallbacteria bacterium]
MRLYILSRRATLYTTRRFTKTARMLGHVARVLDPLGCMLHTTRGRHTIQYHERQLRLPDAVLPRIGGPSAAYSLAVLQQFEARGVCVVNRSEAIARARDKLRSLQLLAEQHVPIAATVMTRDPSRLAESIDMVGGPPVILKLLQGTQGIGVILADSYQTAKETLEALWQLGQNILIQKFISESKGRDIRALVVGQKVVTAMRRVARAGEFRSNIHRGGVGEPLELGERQREVALKAAAVMGLEVAGVDLLEGEDGPIVTEVNSSPGFEGLEKASGLDIAREIIEHAVRLVESSE